MNKRFRTCSLDQPYLLPPSLDDWLPQNHLARFIGEISEELNLDPIYDAFDRRDDRGASAYHPLLLVRLLLYGYMTGVTSSRRIERQTHDDVAFRYLAANQHPDHDTLANFRKQHLESLGQIFVQVLRMCQKAGLVKLGNVAIDGTKILANASVRHSLTHQKLTEHERHWKETVDRLLAEAQRTDQEEDAQWGKGRTQQDLPEELTDAKTRLERIRQAKRELEQEAQQRLAETEKNYPPGKRGRPSKQEIEANGPRDRQATQKGQYRRRRARKNAEQPQRQYNLIDPDSRVMFDTARQGFAQAYNAQAAVDSQAQVIVAAEVTQDGNDLNQLVPMVQAVIEATESKPQVITADAGYWDTMSLRDPVLAEMEVLVSPNSNWRQGLVEQAKSGDEAEAQLGKSSPRTPEARQMRERLSSKEGKELYGTRKAVVEPVFGQIKEARGLRRFRLRGLAQVQAEWKMICATHNLLKLFRHWMGNRALCAA